MVKKDIYRVIGSNETISMRTTSSYCMTEVIYNNRKPLFTSNNFEEADKVFSQLSKEGYMEHMLLIVDFGIMPLGERTRQRMDKSSLTVKWNELVPYMIIKSYHEGFGVKTEHPEVTIASANGNVKRTFHSMVDAMRYFEARLYNVGNMRMTITEHCRDSFSGREKVETRIIVNSKEFKNATSYNPCHKIRRCETRYFTSSIPQLESEDDKVVSLETAVG